ncbi:hypothetical protein GCM10029964_031420 [Kibdelosporangium lantanae]
MAIVRDLIGDPALDVTITSTSLWTVNHNYATSYSSGRVFCAGDAVHRHPPSNGLGSNTSVQDSYNLAWKLAMVIRGQAGPSLLDTYTAERAPIGKQVVDRANLSRDQFGPIFEALGINGDTDAAGIDRGLAACLAETPEGAERRRQLEAAIELKNYEFNAHGVELDQRYSSTAIIHPVTTHATTPTRSPHTQPSPTRPPPAQPPPTPSPPTQPPPTPSPPTRLPPTPPRPPPTRSPLTATSWSTPRQPGPARNSRTPGWSPPTAAGCPHWTSWATAGSPS